MAVNARSRFFCSVVNYHNGVLSELAGRYLIMVLYAL